MQYRIIISCNNKKKKVVFKNNDLSFITKKYFKLKDNNKVLCPVEHIAYKKVKPVKYEIILMKLREKNDTPFIDRDEFGRTTEIEDKNKKWTILYKDDYFYEEKFTLFNYKQRLTTIEIIKNILLKNNKTILVKQVNYINNKVLIHQNNDFDIITCKCVKDAERLYNTLYEFYNSNKLKNIIFTGKISKNKNQVYKSIQEKTGWDEFKMYRTKSRP